MTWQPKQLDYKYETYDIFPITIYHTNIGKNDVWEHRIIHNDWEKMTSVNMRNVGVSSVTTSKNIFEYEKHNTKDELNMLKEHILDHVHNYMYQHYKIKNEFMIASSWGLKLEPGEFIEHYHYHSNSFLSAVYYFSRVENCGGISFERNPYMTPVLIPGIEMDYESENNNNCNCVNFEPYTGDLIIFPSHLKHRVLPNESKQDRYSLACNIHPVGTIGFEERVLHFKK